MEVSLSRKEITKNIAQTVFYLGLTMELLLMLLYKSTYSIASEGLFFRVTFLIFLVKVLMTDYTKKEWGWIILLGAIAFISYRMSSRNDMLRVVVMCAAMKNIDLKKMLRYILTVATAGCLLIVALSLIGVYGTVTLTKVYREETETRYVLGLGHPNQLHAMFWAISTLWMFYAFEKMNLVAWGAIFVANVLLFLLTDSKGGFLGVAAAVVMGVVLQKAKKLRDDRRLYILVIVGIGLLIAGTLAVACYGQYFRSFPVGTELEHPEQIWNYTLIDRFDHVIFNGRLNEAYNHQTTGILHFGLFSNPENIVYMDLGFYKLFYWYGFIPGFIYVILNCMLVAYAYRKKNYALLMFVTDWCLYNFLEAHEITDFLACNFLWFLMGGYFSDMVHANEGKSVYFWEFPALLVKEKADS